MSIEEVGITRRQLSAAALALLAPRRVPGANHFTHALGAELYTVRNILPTAADQTLKSIAEIGYREVEMDHASLPRISPILKNYGLKPVACHFETPLITGNWKAWKNLTNQNMTWDQAIEDAHKFGVEDMVMAYIRPEQRGGLDYYREIADKMNNAGSQSRAAGLKFCYHNHCFEFRGEPGQRPIDILLEL